MRTNGKIDYVELPGAPIGEVKRFYAEAFGWSFIDYGPTYAAFDEGLEGGFDGDSADATRAPLVIPYADDLDAMEGKVRAAGGSVLRPIYSFAGGRRFHLRDPAGNEPAVWGGA